VPDPNNEILETEFEVDRYTVDEIIRLNIPVRGDALRRLIEITEYEARYDHV